MSLFLITLEHIKLSRDMDDDTAICDCDDTRGHEAVNHLDCSCDCHIEIREQQDTISRGLDEEDATSRAVFNLTIQGDSDIIFCAYHANQSAKEGIKDTRSDTRKAYD